MRLFSEAAERNKSPIATVLAPYLEQPVEVLEIASGTGQHAKHFSSVFPHIDWQPTDVSVECIQSIEAIRKESKCANLKPPVRLDVVDVPWPFSNLDVVYCANMIHISPRQSGIAFFDGAGRALKPSGRLLLYGPFLYSDRPNPQSNLDFDLSLKKKNPDWGIWTLEDVKSEAAKHGFKIVELVEMPANNLTLVFQRT